MSEWIGLPQDEEELEKYIGFVYLITRTNITEQEIADGIPYKYIGLKNLKKKKTLKALKGKKRKRISFVQSDYESYYGSSEELKKSVELHGKENFRREVLHMCETKWVLKFMEAAEQIKRNVLFDPCYFNGILNLRIGKCPKALNEKYSKLMSDFF